MSRSVQPSSARRAPAIAVAVLAVTAAAAGCSAEGARTATPERPAAAPRAASAVRAADPVPDGGVHADSVTRAPALVDGERLIVRAAARHGSATVPVDHTRITSGKVAVLINCQGSGTVHVALGSEVAFDQPCTEGEVTATYNVVKDTLANVTALTVQAPPAVHWSVTVGT
ncbi:hypothetical protein ACFQLX_11315 [Streptomyces polyrhachis]|uniref:Lipoprotein n=1 Tax=Streptomyces polyrhachis TaxID=1282885 RepID=A0ABW2GDA8_9ACTN